MQRVVLHVDMDYFFAAIEERENPELQGKAVVVCMLSGRGGLSGAVVPVITLRENQESGQACPVQRQKS